MIADTDVAVFKQISKVTSRKNFRPNEDLRKASKPLGALGKVLLEERGKLVLCTPALGTLEVF